MKTPIPIQAIIFDCDGTLVDSETLTCRAMWQVAFRYGFTQNQSDLIAAVTGTNMARSIEYINTHSPNTMPETFADEVRALQAVLFKSSLTEIEGAQQVLVRLTELGIPFAIATNGPRAKAELTLGITGLLPYFQKSPRFGSCPDLIFSAYEQGTFKPEPELFLLAAAALGLDPSACAVVEDSISGLTASIAAGMQTFSLMPLNHFDVRFWPAPTELPTLVSLLDYV